MEFFDLLKVNYAINPTFEPSLTSDDDCHREDVRHFIERGNLASSEQERVIYSELGGQPPRPGSIYRRICDANNLRPLIPIVSQQVDELRDLGEARRRHVAQKLTTTILPL
jgi:hypothetical protein